MLLSASLTSTIARSCSAGLLNEECGYGTDHSSRDDREEELPASQLAAEIAGERYAHTSHRVGHVWQTDKSDLWSTCRDPLTCAMNFGKRFADQQLDKSSMHGLMALYNYNIGRKVSWCYNIIAKKKFTTNKP